MKHLTVSVLALSALAVGACSEQSQTALEPDAPLFSSHKGGSATAETSPKLIWDWKATLSDNTTSTLIRGDGNAGSPYITYDSDWHTSDPGKPTFRGYTSGQYQGLVCGARATVFWAGTNYGGDAVFDPDLEPKYNGNCGPRGIGIAMDGTNFTPDAPFMNVYRIMDVGAVGTTEETREQWMRIINLSIPQCERLQFGAPTATDKDEVWKAETVGVVVTRLQGTPAYSPRESGIPALYSRWEVQSVAPHKADCLVSKQGKLVDVGDYYLPFRFVISELPSTGSNTRPTGS
jgi:hypothetical protein